jgi:hypothetical protein
VPGHGVRHSWVSGKKTPAIACIGPAGINTGVTLSEVLSPLQAFRATVRVQAAGVSLAARTQIHAEGVQQARALLAKIYGVGNVLSVLRLQEANVAEATQAPNPADAQIKNMQQQARQLNQQARRMRAQRAIQRAQKQIRSVAAS